MPPEHITYLEQLLTLDSHITNEIGSHLKGKSQCHIKH